MSGLNNLKTRLEYQGGARQIDRMNNDKLRSLKKALLYSYQSATAVLADAREFRCLINPNKLSMELDDKVLSIPFEDICLNKKPDAPQTTTEGIEPIGVKCGDVIEWKENGTHWLIYSQYLQETAYFRGQMRQCETDTLTIGENQYYYYLKGPSEKGIDWSKIKTVFINDLNYTLEIYITANQETNQFFQRFKKVIVKGKNFEVQAVDRYTTEGILCVYLKEDYTLIKPEEAPTIEVPIQGPNIMGPGTIYPYDIAVYSLETNSLGHWEINNNNIAVITKTSPTTVTIEVVTGKSGEFELKYVTNEKTIVKKITIESL